MDESADTPLADSDPVTSGLKLSTEEYKLIIYKMFEEIKGENVFKGGNNRLSKIT